jgi:hypothetical protein
MSIFVSIVSYRDTELVHTVDSLFSNADNPDDLSVVVVEQELKNKHKDFSRYPNIIHVKKLSVESKGAGWARKIAMEHYDGEDYFFQTDSHMRFVKGWDTKFLSMMKVAQQDAGTDKVILSQFPAPYTIFTNGEICYPIGDEDFWDEPSWTAVVNTWSGFWAGKRQKMVDRSKPHKSHTILAGLLFTLGEFVEEIPYDDRITFMGEELCIAIRAYTRGWEIYAPNEMVAWHFYKREERPKVWNEHRQARNWGELEFKSQKVQQDILLAVEEGVFGIGDYQRYLEYQNMIGINFEEFYKDELPDKVNLGVISQEIEFDENMDIVMVPKSGYCINNFHKKCLSDDVCFCKCHEKE